MQSSSPAATASVVRASYCPVRALSACATFGRQLHVGTRFSASSLREPLWWTKGGPVVHVRGEREDLGCRRIVSSGTEAPIILVDLV